MNGELVDTSLCGGEEMVSPESGISSASPLSWQEKGSPCVQEPSPVLQPGSYPRNNRPQVQPNINQSEMKKIYLLIFI